MDREEATESTTLVIKRTGDIETETSSPTSRRFHFDNDDGEHTLNMVVVIEDFRVAFYLTSLALTGIGMLLTKAFTKEDYGAIIEDVYGFSNTCIYFDFAPATYILPILWVFAVIFGFLYTMAAILRIHIAYLERKLTRCAFVLLIIAYVYVAFSIILFSIAFAVQPEREKHETMVVHTFSYLNWKLMYAILQVAVVYFGINVSWKNLSIPRWFNTASIVHAVALVITALISFLMILNALADMGEAGMVGRGKWWSVRSKANIVMGNLFVNYVSLVVGIVFPLVHAMFLCRYGVESHALVVAVQDNRPACTGGCKYEVEKRHEETMTIALD